MNEHIRVIQFDELDLELIGFRNIWDKNVPNESGGVIGHRLQVVIWPQFTPGRKTLYFDGFEIPFDLVIHDYPTGR